MGGIAGAASIFIALKWRAVLARSEQAKIDNAFHVPAGPRSGGGVWLCTRMRTTSELWYTCSYEGPEEWSTTFSRKVAYKCLSFQGWGCGNMKIQIEESKLQIVVLHQMHYIHYYDRMVWDQHSEARRVYTLVMSSWHVWANLDHGYGRTEFILGLKSPVIIVDHATRLKTYLNWAFMLLDSQNSVQFHVHLLDKKLHSALCGMWYIVTRFSLKVDDPTEMK